MSLHWQFLEDVYNEAMRAIAKYGTFNSFHEAYAVLLEEVDEWWDHVRLHEDKRDLKAIRTELVQIAAMCLKAALRCHYEEGKRDQS